VVAKLGFKRIDIKFNIDPFAIAEPPAFTRLKIANFN
jgi:hypothetical protein